MSWWPEAFLFGFLGTVVLTTIASGSRGLGLTRMDIPFMLGTMFTPNRDRATWLGILCHLLNGWIFALGYFLLFYFSGLGTWWFGMGLGLVQALFVLTVGMAMIPSIHPRMASENQGPDPTRQLEPPGFLALNYGRQTPIVTVISHLVYGGVLGMFYPN